MKAYTTENLRNVVFLGHSGSGKSTLAEAMLFATKQIERIGRTEDGTLTSDYDPEEQKRQTSINASVLPVLTKTTKINVLDCPGSRDFVGEIAGALRVAESAVIFVDAAAGLEVGTEQAMDYAEANDLPVAFFVNKLDKENADFYKICDQITETFGKKAVPLTIPIGSEGSLTGMIDLVAQKATMEKDGKASKSDIADDMASDVESHRELIIEAAAEGDDALMEKFFDEGSLSDEEMSRGLKASFMEKSFIAVFCGSAQRGIGVTALIEFFTNWFPSPIEGPGLALKCEGDEAPAEPEVQAIDPEKPFSAFVFKTVSDDFAGRLTFFKVITGKLEASTGVHNQTQDTPVKIAHPAAPFGKKQDETETLYAGDLGVAAKLGATATNDTLAEPKNKVQYAPTKYPQRTSVIALQAHSSTDEDKVGMGLHTLIEQDPTLALERDSEVKQTLLRGMGDQHLDVAVNRLKAKAKVEVDLIEPKIRYRETITKKAEGTYRHKKQSGGRGQFAEVSIRLEPLTDGNDFQFTWSVFGGAIPTNYQSAVEKGSRMAMELGVLAAYHATGIHVDCYDGKYHPVDSSDMAFQIASSQAFKQIAHAANPIILEPIANVVTTVPEQYMGDVMGDVSQRRGRIQGSEAQGNKTVVRATVPEAELVTYAQTLRSITGGRGYYEYEFSHYEPVPPDVQAKIVEKALKDKAEEN